MIPGPGRGRGDSNQPGRPPAHVAGPSRIIQREREEA